VTHGRAPIRNDETVSVAPMASGVQLALPCTAMALDHPLPFRLKIPGEDTLDWRGARSISYRLDGLLHVVGDVITFEWAEIYFLPPGRAPARGW
jgi:hypothetical protein